MNLDQFNDLDAYATNFMLIRQNNSAIGYNNRISVYPIDYTLWDLFKNSDPMFDYAIFDNGGWGRAINTSLVAIRQSVDMNHVEDDNGQSIGVYGRTEYRMYHQASYEPNGRRNNRNMESYAGRRDELTNAIIAACVARGEVPGRWIRGHGDLPTRVVVDYCLGFSREGGPDKIAQIMERNANVETFLTTNNWWRAELRSVVNAHTSDYPVCLITHSGERTVSVTKFGNNGTCMLMTITIASDEDDVAMSYGEQEVRDLLTYDEQPYVSWKPSNLDDIFINHEGSVNFSVHAVGDPVEGIIGDTLTAKVRDRIAHFSGNQKMSIDGIQYTVEPGAYFFQPPEDLSMFQYDQWLANLSEHLVFSKISSKAMALRSFHSEGDETVTSSMNLRSIRSMGKSDDSPTVADRVNSPGRLK